MPVKNVFDVYYGNFLIGWGEEMESFR